MKLCIHCKTRPVMPERKDHAKVCAPCLMMGFTNLMMGDDFPYPGMTIAALNEHLGDQFESRAAELWTQLFSAQEE